jgi:Bacterial membrane protein YfhO.
MNMKKDMLKRAGIIAGIVLLFLVLAYGFVPQVLSGKIVNQHDILGYTSMSHRAADWNAAHPDDRTYWTDAMFSGMPVTSFMTTSEGDWTQKLYDLLLTGKRPATYFFISLLGAFLLMLSLGIDTLIAVTGAIAVTFCSYNMQIIQAGHNTKMQALAFLPWVLAAVIFTYKSALKKVKGWRSWLPATALGATLFGFALSLQIKANHQQITYYLALIIVIYVLTLFIWMVMDRERRSMFGRFIAASVLLLTIGLAGIGTNAVKLAPLYEYSKYTMRGGSELTGAEEGHQINDKGLQLDYATAWSYGIEELPNLMIPDFNGGSSVAQVDPSKSHVVKLLKESGEQNAESYAKYLPMYWGSQPFTSGPMYMGVITVFLFLLGLCLYRGKEKWWMLSATVLAIFLGLGSNMMWFTKLFFNYMPMYDKFRTVSMALVILQFTLPMLGFLTLDRIMKKEYSRADFLRKGWPALALTAGFCLVVMVLPRLFGSFSSPLDVQFSEDFIEPLKMDRISLMRSDALWSMLYVLATFLLILWAYSVPPEAPESYESDPHIGNARRVGAAIGIGVLVLINMFTTGHRYLGSKDFVTPRAFNGNFKERPVDQMILADSTLSYRVLDLSADVFNDSFTPYWHRSIGGYSPAKLQRYQDLIEKHIAGEIVGVNKALEKCSTIAEAENSVSTVSILSALNCKYFILGAEYPPLVNSNAYGNAWFVDSISVAATPDDEIAAIGEHDLRQTMIIGRDFSEAGAEVASVLDSCVASEGDSIDMTYCGQNELRYHYTLSSARPAVFSEIYYPKGWVATIDGNPAEIFRCNWIFRGMLLPEGEHEVTMRFEPKVYSTSKAASRASSAALTLILIASLAGVVFLKKEDGSAE